MHKIVLPFLLAIICSFPVAGQEDYVPTFEDTMAVYEDLFEIEEPLNLTLKFDVKQLVKTKWKEEYLPALMTCHVNENFEVSHEVRLKARGQIRKNVCTKPMFWINIKHSGIAAEDLTDVTKLKMVVRCKASNTYEDYVLREYLTYKIWNLLSPYSFNVRLVKLKIIDTSRNDKESVDWAFLIEPEEMLAERNNSVPINNDRLSVRTVDREWMDKVAFFSYMVGQSDYSVTGRHNLKILTSKDYGATGVIPVPYDFDYCGLVNAEYAVPGTAQEGIGLSSVRERYFQGACRSEEIYQETVDWLASHRDEIMDLINSFEYMGERGKKDMIDYLDSYYRESGQSWFIDRSVNSTCL